MSEEHTCRTCHWYGMKVVDYASAEALDHLADTAFRRCMHKRPVVYAARPVGTCTLWAAAEPAVYRPGNGPFWTEPSTGEEWGVHCGGGIFAFSSADFVEAKYMVDALNKACQQWAAKSPAPHPHIHRLLEVVIGPNPNQPRSRLKVGIGDSAKVDFIPDNTNARVTCGSNSVYAPRSDVWLHYDNGTFKNAGTGIVYSESIYD